MLKTISFAARAVALVLSCAPSLAKSLNRSASRWARWATRFSSPVEGCRIRSQKTNPNVKVTTVGFEYDLGKQVTQIDNFTPPAST